MDKNKKGVPKPKPKPKRRSYSRLTKMNGIKPITEVNEDKINRTVYDCVSVRFPKGFKERLEAASEKIGIAQNDVTRRACIAAVEFIEKNGRISFPFVITDGSK